MVVALEGMVVYPLTFRLKLNFSKYEEPVHMGKSPGPALAEGKFLPRTPNTYPDCLRVAHCHEEKQKSIAPSRPAQPRVLLGSGSPPGQNPARYSQCPPFPGHRTLRPRKIFEASIEMVLIETLSGPQNVTHFL